MTKLAAVFLSLVLALIPLAGSAESAVNREGEPIRLDVYSQLANYAGVQKGWGAVLMKDLFNVELNIIPDQDGTYATRMESGSLGDLVVWGSNGDDYKNAVAKGMLLDWEQYDIGKKHAPYIMDNYGAALESNREVSGDGKIHGFGHSVAFQEDSHQSFFYSWDIRWDLYRQLGYPTVKNLDDMVELFTKMKAICPTDELGNETYAVSIWPDWDGNMVMYVKALATAYYGLDELGYGHYDPRTGEYIYCLEDGSPYMECLAFFNRLNREGLLDPNSSSNTYDKMSEKLKNAGTFWSIFNYAGSMAFNTDEHLKAGKYMYTMVPEEATPIVYGLGAAGGERIWSVGNYTQHPEICLEILNWMSTPEGSMTMWYGPKGLTWDYDENRGMYFTELGKKTSADSAYNMAGIEWTSPYTGKTYALDGTYNDGSIQINNVTLAKDMINPEGNGIETFNKDTWASVANAVSYEIQEDWREHNHAVMTDDYLENRTDAEGNKMYVLMPSIPYSESERSPELSLIWEQCAKTIRDYTWRAINAKSEGEYNFHIQEMRRLVKQYGIEQCNEWSRQEAAQKWRLTQELNP